MKLILSAFLSLSLVSPGVHAWGKTKIEEVVDGEVITHKYRKGDYKAKLEADLLREQLDKSHAHELQLAAIEQAKGPACPPPNLSGVAESAAEIMADAYKMCVIMHASGAGNNVADAIYAATGNSKSAAGQMYRSHNQKVVRLEEQRTISNGNWLNFAGLGLNTLGGLYLASRTGDGNNGGNSIGDGNTIVQTQSLSGAQFGGAGEGFEFEGGGEEGGTGFIIPGSRTTSDQVRQGQQSIFGGNIQGYGKFEAGSRGAFSLTDFACNNDVSGTLNCFRGTQKSSLVADQNELGGDFRTSDDDGHLF